MAIIRTAALGGAALIALAAIVPATSHAQGPGAPLELVPGPNQAKPTRGAINNRNAAKTVAKAAAKSATNKSASSNKSATNKSTTRTAARKSPRQDTAERPAPKTARANPRTDTNIAASRQKQVASNAQRGRATPKQSVIRTAVVPYLTVSRPVLRRGTKAPPIIARGPNTDTSEDRAARGRDSISLVATLPWWRNDRMQDVSYGSAVAESKVLEAAAVWIAANGGAAEDERPAGETFGHPSVDEAVDVADANELNDIDLAAGPVPAPTSPGFMQSLLALIGGAAAAAVASARLLFT
ncbi:MAG TPA: hypothetical protein VFB68_13730 [Xanthobacteraceae bacterium]|nr:hypothetical protein [Xanthobacteraceae bacterium]